MPRPAGERKSAGVWIPMPRQHWPARAFKSEIHVLPAFWQYIYEETIFLRIFESCFGAGAAYDLMHDGGLCTVQLTVASAIDAIFP